MTRKRVFEEGVEDKIKAYWQNAGVDDFTVHGQIGWQEAAGMAEFAVNECSLDLDEDDSDVVALAIEQAKAWGVWSGR